MIPPTWLPHFRGSDGELVDYLDRTEPAVVPPAGERLTLTAGSC